MQLMFPLPASLITHLSWEATHDNVYIMGIAAIGLAETWALFGLTLKCDSLDLAAMCDIKIMWKGQMQTCIKRLALYYHCSSSNPTQILCRYLNASQCLNAKHHHVSQSHSFSFLCLCAKQSSEATNLLKQLHVLPWVDHFTFDLDA